jgi:hypothetical protein
VDAWLRQVRPTIGTRLGTSAPTDIFAILSENLTIVKQKSSPSLQVCCAISYLVDYTSRISSLKPSLSPLPAQYSPAYLLMAFA